MIALRHTGYMTATHLRQLWRQPWWIAVSLVQPVIWLLLFGALFESVADLPGFGTDSYIEFLAPGIVIMTAFFSAGWTGMGLLEDLDRGVTDRLLVSPISRPRAAGGPRGSADDHDGDPVADHGRDRAARRGELLERRARSGGPDRRCGPDIGPVRVAVDRVRARHAQGGDADRDAHVPPAAAVVHLGHADQPGADAGVDGDRGQLQPGGVGRGGRAGRRARRGRFRRGGQPRRAPRSASSRWPSGSRSGHSRSYQRSL